MAIVETGAILWKPGLSKKDDDGNNNITKLFASPECHCLALAASDFVPYGIIIDTARTSHL